jgi:hypothetical protein
MVEPLAAPLAAWLLQLGQIPSLAMFGIGWLRAPSKDFINSLTAKSVLAGT